MGLLHTVEEKEDKHDANDNNTQRNSAVQSEQDEMNLQDKARKKGHRYMMVCGMCSTK